MKMGEDVFPVVEGIATDKDAFLCVLEELSYHDQGVAGGADEGFRAGPDKVDAGDGTVAPFRDGDPQDGLKGRAVKLAECPDVLSNVLEGVGREGSFRRRRADPFSFD
jgi:hypothetical protein